MKWYDKLYTLSDTVIYRERFTKMSFPITNSKRSETFIEFN